MRSSEGSWLATSARTHPTRISSSRALRSTMAMAMDAKPPSPRRPAPRKECGVVDGMLGTCCSARWAVAQVPTVKDEDRYVAHACAIDGVADAAFAVYDGHGGATASTVCANVLLEQVKQSLAGLKTQQEKTAEPADEKTQETPVEDNVEQNPGPWDPLLNQALKQTFVEMDNRIKSRVPDGTTATLVLLKLDEEGWVHMKCAWAGDSRSLLLREGKKVDPLSIDHNPTNEQEAIRMRAFKREELLQMQGLPKEGSSPKKDPTKQRTVNLNTFRIVPDQLDRGAFRQSPDVTPETSTHGEDQYTIFDIAQIAQRSFIGKFVDPNTGMSGCKRIFSTSMASSLAVSRTIGDKGAARCVTAEPEIIDQKLAPGEKGRIMIASDGIWDIMSNRKALDCWYPRDPLVACKSITDEAFEARRYTGYHPDDITLVLVDINRSDKTRKKRYSVGGVGGSNYNSENSGQGTGGSVYSGMSTDSSDKSKSVPPMQPQACCSIQ